MTDLSLQKTLDIKDKKLAALFDDDLSNRNQGESESNNVKRQINYTIPPHLANSKAQYQLLCTLHYGGHVANNDVESLNFLSKEIVRKVNGYKQQDVKRKLYDSKTLITPHQIQKKLIDETMTCCFCNKHVSLLFDTVRDMSQWTLDRIDNNLGHSDRNTKIACLQCNLQRRRQDYDSFHWTKNLCISKVDKDDDDCDE
jgi:hypothetical protein